jgi:hypothetical protein
VSKTSQRKFSAYQSGLDDGIQGLPVRWSRHPKLDHYLAGYRDGSRARQPQRPRGLNFWERLLFVIFGDS